MTSFCSCSTRTSRSGICRRSVAVRSRAAPSTEQANDNSSVAMDSQCLAASAKSFERSFSFFLEQVKKHFAIYRIKINSFNKFTLTAMVDKLRDNFAATSTGAGLWRMNSVSGKLLLTLPQSMRLQTNCQRIRSNQCHNTELWSGNWKLPGDRPSNCTHHVLWSAIEPER